MTEITFPERFVKIDGLSVASKTELTHKETFKFLRFPESSGRIAAKVSTLAQAA